MCVFARHNLIDDPPFSEAGSDHLPQRADLSEKRTEECHPAVFTRPQKPTGFLMLGGSEGTAASDLFSIADEKAPNLCQEGNREEDAVVSRNGRPCPPGHTIQAATGPPLGSRVWGVMRGKRSTASSVEVQPAGVVVDDDLEVSRFAESPVPTSRCRLEK